MNSRNYIEHQLDSLAFIKGYFLYNLNTVVASLLPAGLRRAQVWVWERAEPVSTAGHGLPQAGNQSVRHMLSRAQRISGEHSLEPEVLTLSADSQAAGYTEPLSGPTVQYLMRSPGSDLGTCTCELQTAGLIAQNSFQIFEKRITSILYKYYA